MDIEKEVFQDEEDALPKEFEHMSVDSINQRARLLENEIRVLKDESTRLNLDQQRQAHYVTCLVIQQQHKAIKHACQACVLLNRTHHNDISAGKSCVSSKLLLI
jgi:uncharacterized small protein (DUF1192 family)